MNKERRQMKLAEDLRELIALGWTDEEAKGLKETFFERIGEEYTANMTEKEIWNVWNEVWEQSIEHLLENEQFMNVCQRLADEATDYIREKIRKRGE